MALEGHGRLHHTEKSRTLIYVSQTLANDSQFPFKHSEELRIRIDPENERLIIEKAK